MKKPRRSPRRPGPKPQRASVPAFAPVPTRRRRDGWTPEKQIDFLEALAESACVEEACRTVGMSRQSAYRLYTRVDAQGFRMAWEAALTLGVRRLSEACFSRALHGEAVPQFYKGEQIGERRRYDNRLAMFLLRYRDPLRYAASLDQMVYSGHPDQAALAFARARDRAEEDAFAHSGSRGDDSDEEQAAENAPPVSSDHDRGAEEEAFPSDPPWRQRPIHQELAQARERALIEGDAPIDGPYERRARLEEARRVHRRATGADRARVEEQEAFERKIAELGAQAGIAPLGGPVSAPDVASPSSPSAGDPPRAQQPQGPRCRTFDSG